MIQTAISGDSYRLIVEVPGLTDIDQALNLIGTTAMLDFRLQDASQAAQVPTLTADASLEAQLTQYIAMLDSFTVTGLQGSMLKKATATFDPQTNQPVISLQFSPEGTELFAQITREHTGSVLGIFIDDWPATLPVINTPILDGNAVISGNFTLADAQTLAVQLNSGALPVPLTILSQNQVGASLGSDSINSSIFAGIVGLFLVALFMIFNYGYQGFLGDISLIIYSIITIALYKIFGITLSLPSITALLLSMGMAVDSNILIFSRLREELHAGKTLDQAREQSFGRAWDSIRDANVITLSIAFILINPFNFAFLNSSGIIRGFGITLFLGVAVGLFTGIFVTRGLLRIFLRSKTTPQKDQP
jgi:preprotein translocase subunit SecD